MSDAVISEDRTSDKPSRCDIAVVVPAFNEAVVRLRQKAGLYSEDDGQVDFRSMFSKLAANDFEGWAVLEWECCLKHPEDGAREGAAFIKDHIIRVTDRAFDDFADAGTNDAANARILGLD